MVAKRVQVVCYSGHTYAERPESLIWDGIYYLIKRIEKEWREPGARLFQVLTEDGRSFILSYNEGAAEWSAFQV